MACFGEGTWVYVHTCIAHFAGYFSLLNKLHTEFFKKLSIKILKLLKWQELADQECWVGFGGRDHGSGVDRTAKPVLLSGFLEEWDRLIYYVWLCEGSFTGLC